MFGVNPFYINIGFFIPLGLVRKKKDIFLLLFFVEHRKGRKYKFLDKYMQTISSILIYGRHVVLLAAGHLLYK